MRVTVQLDTEFNKDSSDGNSFLIEHNFFTDMLNLQVNIAHQKAARLNVSNWARGMYVAVVFSNDQIKGRCKVLVE